MQLWKLWIWIRKRLKIFNEISNNTSEEVQDFILRVVNLLGEKIIKEDLQKFVGEYVKVIDPKQLRKGYILLEITTNKGVINKKLK